MMRSQGFIAERAPRTDKLDWPFVIICIALCGIGFVTLYTGSLAYASRLFDDPLYFVKRQGIILAIGLVSLVIFASVSLDFLRTHLSKLVLVTLIMSILPFIPGIGITKNGASRWINLGPMTFQPSELVKMVLVIFLANLFSKKFDRMHEPEVSVYPATIMSFLMISIVYLQDDFSTALFIIVIALIMFFLAGVKIVWFIKLCALSLPFIVLMIVTREYRVKRVLSFFHPEHDPLGAGYQVNAALTALSEGGFWGRGLGNGIRKIASIPEVQSDFIFAVWSEEMGFFGVVLYFALLIAFALRGFWIALECEDRFRSLMCFGCVSIIFFQSLVNCGVVVRAFPATGIPLPFFSSGGSSLLITLCLCGLIINVSRWKNKREMDYV